MNTNSLIATKLLRVLLMSFTQLSIVMAFSVQSVLAAGGPSTYGFPDIYNTGLADSEISLIVMLGVLSVSLGLIFITYTRFFNHFVLKSE